MNINNYAIAKCTGDAHTKNYSLSSLINEVLDLTNNFKFNIWNNNNNNKNKSYYTKLIIPNEIFF